MMLTRRQLRRLIKEAVRGPESGAFIFEPETEDEIMGHTKSDEFILDPELAGDETHPVLTRRSPASYDAHVDPDDIKKLADLYGMSDEEFAVQSDELTDTLLGDEPGTREYSRSSREYSIREGGPMRTIVPITYDPDVIAVDPNGDMGMFWPKYPRRGVLEDVEIFIPRRHINKLKERFREFLRFPAAARRLGTAQFHQRQDAGHKMGDQYALIRNFVLDRVDKHARKRVGPIVSKDWGARTNITDHDRGYVVDWGYILNTGIADDEFNKAWKLSKNWRRLT